MDIITNVPLVKRKNTFNGAALIGWLDPTSPRPERTSCYWAPVYLTREPCLTVTANIKQYSCWEADERCAATFTVCWTNLSIPAMALVPIKKCNLKWETEEPLSCLYGLFGPAGKRSQSTVRPRDVLQPSQRQKDFTLKLNADTGDDGTWTQFKRVCPPGSVVFELCCIESSDALGRPLVATALSLFFLIYYIYFGPVVGLISTWKLVSHVDELPVLKVKLSRIPPATQMVDVIFVDNSVSESIFCTQCNTLAYTYCYCSFWSITTNLTYVIH